MARHRKVTVRIGITLATIAMVTTSALLAVDWHQYRGPNRDGTSPETELAAGWYEEGPPELWRVSIGPAYSGLTVVGDRIYTMGSDESSEYVVAFDTKDGHQIWRTAVGKLFENDYGNGPRSTPTWHDGMLFVVGSLGRVEAIRASDGKVVWQIDVQNEFDSELPTWAFTSAPLVVGDDVIVEVGGANDRTIAAFDRESGRLQWTGGVGAQSYSSPIEIPFNGVHQLVFLIKQGLIALTPDGETIWRSEFVSELGIKPAPPVFVEPDLVFVSASYDAGAKVVRMIPDGESVRVEDLWEHRLMRNHFNGSVAVEGHLCGFDKATLKCIDAENGKQTWAKRGLGKGSLIMADGKFFVLGERGKLVVLEADPASLVELASHQVLSGRCWTQPSLADGMLYLRNNEEMVKLDLRRKDR